MLMHKRGGERCWNDFTGAPSTHADERQRGPRRLCPVWNWHSCNTALVSKWEFCKWSRENQVTAKLIQTWGGGDEVFCELFSKYYSNVPQYKWIFKRFNEPYKNWLHFFNPWNYMRGIYSLEDKKKKPIYDCEINPKSLTKKLTQCNNHLPPQPLTQTYMIHSLVDSLRASQNR